MQPNAPAQALAPAPAPASARVASPARAAILAVAVIALIGPAAPARAEDSAEDVFRNARAYTVRIRTQITTPFVEDSRGSFEGAGFLMDAERGWVVTNAHVVGRSPSQIQVAFADQPYRPAEKVYVDPFADIAVIQLGAKDRQHAVAPIGCEEALRVGEPIGVFGHPLGLPFTGSRGIVSGLTDKFGPDLIQIDATVDHGNSGGPVIALKSGMIVGIATAGAGGNKADRLNFATPIGDVCRILELLREGESPTPPHMALTLLIDEDARTTLQVGSSNDTKHWPLEQGDWIVAVADGDSLTSVGQFVTALRGRHGEFALAVNRNGHRQTVKISPVPQSSIVGRRGLSVDGALIAPVEFEDASTLREPVPLILHSVEPGSNAEMLGLGPQDIVRSVDGKKFADVDRLLKYLETRKSGTPIKLVVLRWSGEQNRIFEYHVRELPGEDVHMVGVGGR